MAETTTPESVKVCGLGEKGVPGTCGQPAGSFWTYGPHLFFICNEHADLVINEYGGEVEPIEDLGNEWLHRKLQHDSTLGGDING